MDRRNLKVMLDQCGSWSNNYGATLSASKRQIVMQRLRGDKAIYGSFTMHGDTLDIMDKAEHLGLPVCRSGQNAYSHVQARIAKARRAIHGSLSLYDRKKRISMMLKLRQV